MGSQTDAVVRVFVVLSLCTSTVPEPVPQSPYANRRWAQSLRNHSMPTFDFLDPATLPVADPVVKTHVPRQSGLYGAPLPFGYPGTRNTNPFPPPPPPPQPSGYPSGFSQGPQATPQGFPQGFGQGFPQIYKVDNLIIIANPPQQQACVPQSNVKPLDPSTFPGTDNTDLDNRFGENEEPSKCTWAIVACCAPSNPTVRYNCFELMGCPGLFLDQSPCSPAIVEAATRAALAFYRNSNGNTNSTVSDNNRV